MYLIQVIGPPGNVTTIRENFWTDLFKILVQALDFEGAGCIVNFQMLLVMQPDFNVLPSDCYMTYQIMATTKCDLFAQQNKMIAILGKEITVYSDYTIVLKFDKIFDDIAYVHKNAKTVNFTTKLTTCNSRHSLLSNIICPSINLNNIKEQTVTSNEHKLAIMSLAKNLTGTDNERSPSQVCISEYFSILSRSSSVCLHSCHRKHELLILISIITMRLRVIH